MKSITESASNYEELEKQSVRELLDNINREDQQIAQAVAQCIPVITVFVSQLLERFLQGGRLFYIGAGTSGRLGVLDASEIPPTFGMPHDRVVGLIAGGDGAIRKAVEFAEDDPELAQKDLAKYQITTKDTVVGIAASGTTPYVIGGLKYANSCKALTACITNNLNTPLAEVAQHPLEVIVGPEFITGSTRMKSGTSQKLVLNMISTALMVKFGRVKGNKMVNMQLNNNKLKNRGVRFIIEELGISGELAKELLNRYGSVSEVLKQHRGS